MVNYICINKSILQVYALNKNNANLSHVPTVNGASGNRGVFVHLHADWVVKNVFEFVKTVMIVQDLVQKFSHVPEKYV